MKKIKDGINQKMQNKNDDDTAKVRLKWYSVGQSMVL